MKRTGFTLVEMAVVVAIVGLLLTLGLRTATATLQNAQRSETRDSLLAVRTALMAYFTANHRFPCPDSGPAAGRDGVEDHTTAGNVATACAAGGGVGVGMGTVPYVTLGLSRGQALDAYGNFITYRVDSTAIPLPIANWNGAVNYSLNELVMSGASIYQSLQNNNINQATNVAAYWSLSPAASRNSWVQANNGAGARFACNKNMAGSLAVYSSAAVQETARAMVVLISHGANGFGAWASAGLATAKNTAPTSAAELGNTQLAPAGPAGYRDYPFSDVVGATSIDDQLVFIDSTLGATEATGALKTYSANLGRFDICR